MYRILNNNDTGLEFRQKINENFSELYADHIPANHASTSDYYGLGTNSLYGHLRVQGTNGLGVNNGTVTMARATITDYGTVKLASSSSSTSTTDVVTSKVLYDAMRGQGNVPRIYYGTSNPTSSNTTGSQNGDLYIKIT